MIDLTAVQLAAKVMNGLGFGHPTILGLTLESGYCKTLQYSLQVARDSRRKSHTSDTPQRSHSGLRAWQT